MTNLRGTLRDQASAQVLKQKKKAETKNKVRKMGDT